MTLHPRETFVDAGDARICVQTFGDPSDQAVLLIGGAASAMDYWEDEFCARIADADRFVIRYDFRDTGRSTSYPAGEPGYTGADLVTDAIAVLDGLAIDTAHLVGVSMGGGIAQVLALHHPARVAGLVLMSTTPADAGAADRAALPPMDPRLEAVFASGAVPPDWTDRAPAVEAMVEGERAFAGSLGFDAQRARDISTRIFDRTEDMAATQTNHWILDGGEPTRGLLEDISVPTLVMHGTEDPLFPYGHAEALAREIPGARLVPLPHAGHQYPPVPLWDLVVAEIVRHTA